MGAKPKIQRLVLFLIPIGIAINFVGGSIARLLRLPMWLDSIGTIVVAALCGAIPGAAVGLVSNILNSITDPVTVFYAIVNILFAFIAYWCSKNKVFLSFWKTMLSVFVFALIGGGISAVITWVVYGFELGGGNSAIFAIPLYNIIGLPEFVAQFIAEVLTDILDKLVTLLAVFFVLQAIPVRLLAKLPLGEIYIKDES